MAAPAAIQAATQASLTGSGDPTSLTGSGDPTSLTGSGDLASLVGSGDPTSLTGSGDLASLVGSGDPTSRGELASVTDVLVLDGPSAWFSLSLGSTVPAITHLRFDPPLEANCEVELRVGTVRVALEDAFCLPEATDPRSLPARHVVALEPAVRGSFLDNALPERELSVRLRRGGTEAPSTTTQRLVVHGLNVALGGEGLLYSNAH